MIQFLDWLNVASKVHNIAAAYPRDRQKLIRYIRQYLRKCEWQEARTVLFRRRVNDE